jgi:DNA topoisomerase-1
LTTDNESASVSLVENIFPAKNRTSSPDSGNLMAKKRSQTSTAAAVATSAATTVETKPAPEAKGSGSKKRFRGPIRGAGYTAGAAKGKHLVIVESPSKAKTINKYLGGEYVVLASVGHVRDLPNKNPKGVKSPVPGVDLEHDFKPTYVINEEKEKVIADLKRAAKDSLSSGHNIWFATDLDREGEAIAWHLAQELGITSKDAKRVMFAAITKAEIERAFKNPHPIDEDRVNAQQARRILDRIVGYQVSPLLWKKVARGLSAGRVQSVATRLVVERERDIRKFIPDEYWAITANFTPEVAKAAGLADSWMKLLSMRDAKGNGPILRTQNAWLSEHNGFKAELVEIAGQKFELGAPGTEPKDLSARATQVAQAAGLMQIKAETKEDKDGKGPARFVRTVSGRVDPTTPYKVTAIDTKRTTSRPGPPFITSTLQQAASSRLGFNAQRTMRTAQNLYEGVDIPGEGPVGLITYMRTDSTHLTKEALDMARGYVKSKFGDKYLPETPNFFTSSNKSAQEAHEAIRPTNVELTPGRVKNALNPDQYRLYQIIWERFVSCQMVPAQWDSTAVTIVGGRDAKQQCTFRATGRVLVFDGFYKVSGVPTAADEQTLPSVKEGTPLAPFSMDVTQKFTSPPPRYTEASLIKELESEGIGRPSTYASIIGVIQDRKYVEQLERRFYSTDLGEVVTDKLIEAFPKILDVGYTRDMELQLDKIEEDHLDWVDMLRKFYGPFKKALKEAEDTLTHAKAETVPAPDEYKCPQCGSGLVYRFGKNGRFLSCSTYPTCNYASPVDRDGKPRPSAETVDVACPKCGSAMTKRVGKFGPFLGCPRYNDKANPCDGILNIDKKGKVVAPSPKPLITDLPCPTCQSPLNLRNGVRGPWLGCSRFPKCRGRGKWQEVPPEKQQEFLKAMEKHEKANPTPIIKTMDGKPLTDSHGKPLPTALPVGVQEGEETLEQIADEVGV